MHIPSIIFDTISLIPLIVGTYRGFKKGFILQLISLFTLFLFLFLSSEGAEIIADFFVKYFGNRQNMLIFYFFIFFCFSVFIVHILIRFLEKKINKKPLNFPTKVLGFMFGSLRYAFLGSSILVIIHQILLKNNLMTQTLLDNSYIYSFLLKVSPYIYPILEFK